MVLHNVNEILGTAEGLVGILHDIFPGGGGKEVFVGCM